MKSTWFLRRSPRIVLQITAYKALSSVKMTVSNHKYWGGSSFPRRIQGRKQRVQKIYMLLGIQKEKKIIYQLSLATFFLVIQTDIPVSI